MVGANFFKLSASEIPSQTGKKPNAIYDFPERLQELIGKYKPVNPQTISEELKRLQSAFNDSQDKLNNSIKNINEAISDMRKELTNEISKREQESIRITSQLSGLERKMENLNDTSIRHDQGLIAVKDGLKDIKEDLKNEIRDLKADVNQSNQTFSSIKTWAKIIGAILAVGGGIIGGIVTGIFEKFLGIIG